MIIEPVMKYRCRHLDFGFATEPWQLKAYYDLRKDIFCEEQGIFEGADIDILDAGAIHIIASCMCMGMADQVVGVVRIDEREPGVWYGSRLGVAAEYRSLSRFQAYHLFDRNEVVQPFTISIGAALIFKAVSTARALGCQRFFANVQHQNVGFFSRMHWRSLGELTLHDYLHHRMEADLTKYPASVYCDNFIQKIA